eukprot:9082300-Heterocapsa_arctica.AAC.1
MQGLFRRSQANGKRYARSVSTEGSQNVRPGGTEVAQSQEEAGRIREVKGAADRGTQGQDREERADGWTVKAGASSSKARTGQDRESVRSDQGWFAALRAVEESEEL